MRLALFTTSVLALYGCTKEASPPVVEHSEVRLGAREEVRVVAASPPEVASPAQEPPPHVPETSPTEPADIGAHRPQKRAEARPEPSGKSSRRCVGRPRPAPKPPRAACCYPSKAPLVAAMNAVRPRLSSCVALMTEDEAVVPLRIAVGPSGAPDEICTDAPPQRNPRFVQCVLEAVQSARFPALSPEDEELCGLLKLSYPLRFEKPAPTP